MLAISFALKHFRAGLLGPFTPADILPVESRTSEDCLFLDVLLPKGIWDALRTSHAPVLV